MQTFGWDKGVGALLQRLMSDDLVQPFVALHQAGSFDFDDRFLGVVATLDVDEWDADMHSHPAAEVVPVALASHGAYGCLEAVLDRGWTSSGSVLTAVLHWLLHGQRDRALGPRVMILAKRLLDLGAQPQANFASALAWRADNFSDAEMAMCLPVQVDGDAINRVLWSLHDACAPSVRSSEEGLIRVLDILEARGACASGGALVGQGLIYPVHAAAKYDLPRVLLWLLEHGADPQKRMEVLGRLRTTSSMAPKNAIDVKSILRAWKQQAGLTRKVHSTALRTTRKRL